MDRAINIVMILIHKEYFTTTSAIFATYKNTFITITTGWPYNKNTCFTVCEIIQRNTINVLDYISAFYFIFINN